MEFMGKVPPHHNEAEQSVLGSMMLDKMAVTDSLSIITPNDFYREAHKEICQAIVMLFNKNEPTDIVSVMDELIKVGKLEECGGVEYLGELSSKGTLTTNASHYSRIILEKANSRRIIKLCSEGIERGYSNEDSQELKNYMIDGLMQIRKKTDSVSNIRDAVMEAYDEIEKDNQGISNTIKTGFKDLDRLTGGVARGDFALIAARPSMGKTAFAMNITSNASKVLKDKTEEQLVGAYFSYEMPKRKLAKRLAFSESSISNNKVKAGLMEDKDWTNLAMACGNISNQKIYIDDDRRNTMVDIKSRCYEIKQEEGRLDFIMIDHIGLVKPNDPRDTRNNQVSQISNDCKTLAMELDCAVFGLNQLSRGVERRDNKRPIMSDLKDSGTLEEDADIIWFLYRDEYYYPDSEKKGIGEVITAKSRDGKTGTTELCWIGKYTRFENLARV